MNHIKKIDVVSREINFKINPHDMSLLNPKRVTRNLKIKANIYIINKFDKIGVI